MRRRRWQQNMCSIFTSDATECLLFELCCLGHICKSGDPSSTSRYKYVIRTSEIQGTVFSVPNFLLVSS